MRQSFHKYLQGHKPEIQAIIWMLMACFWFSIMSSIIRHVSQTVPTFEMVFFRNLFALITMLPWLYKNGFKSIKSERWDLYSYRTISGTIGMCLFFYALSVMPLMDVIALTFTIPLITTLFASIFLAKKLISQMDSLNYWFHRCTYYNTT